MRARERAYQRHRHSLEIYVLYIQKNKSDVIVNRTNTHTHTHTSCPEKRAVPSCTVEGTVGLLRDRSDRTLETSSSANVRRRSEKCVLCLRKRGKERWKKGDEPRWITETALLCSPKEVIRFQCTDEYWKGAILVWRIKSVVHFRVVDVHGNCRAAKAQPN